MKKKTNKITADWNLSFSIASKCSIMVEMWMQLWDWDQDIKKIKHNLKLFEYSYIVKYVETHPHVRFPQPCDFMRKSTFWR